METFGVGTRMAQAVELAFQFRQHQGDGFGRTCGGGDHGKGGGSGPAKILVGEIQQALITRVGVNGRHEAAFNAEIFKHYLGYRCQAVGGARRIGNDVVLFGVVLVLR